MAEQTLAAVVAGTVRKIERQEGESVAQDEAVIVLESMKMEIPAPAPANGKVVKLLVAQGDVVTEGQPLAIIETS
jgi:acetyl-CoA carboxylase biotin carboxyl carrier protein